MRRFIRCILLICLTGLIQFPLSGQVAGTVAEKAGSNLLVKPFLRVITFNIRYNNPGDSANAWPYRKETWQASMIRFHHADLAGLQEALKGQIDDLVERLPGYGWFGVGRDDGQKKGEFSARVRPTHRTPSTGFRFAECAVERRPPFAKERIYYV